MGKRIIQQARGKGSGTYRVRRKAFTIRLKYPSEINGDGIVVKFANSAGHTAPIAKILYSKGVFFMPAFEGMFEGQKINFETKEVKDGNIMRLADIPVKTKIYCVESRPGDGGVFIKTAGSSAVVSRIAGDYAHIMFPSKKEKKLNKNCRAIVGTIAGGGRLDKPFVKAGRKHHLMKAQGKLWPRTSPIKVNVVDHPFGSGRGKRAKSKIAKRNAPPGRKVGMVRPKRTGRKKR